MSLHDECMKRVSLVLSYPGTTVPDVFAMFGDPAYRRAVADHQHVVDFDCRISMDGEGMDVRLEEAHSTDRIPGFAQKLVGPEIRFVQQETWASPTSADLHVTIPGRPGVVTGTQTLTQSGADVVQHIDLTVRASVPIVGGKVEDLIAGFIGKAFRAENHVAATWLAAGER
jgi:Protein of unknown function (DUF2505)